MISKKFKFNSGISCFKRVRPMFHYIIQKIYNFKKIQTHLIDYFKLIINYSH